MIKTTIPLAAALTVGVAAAAAAQVTPPPAERAFFNINVGAQSTRHDFESVSVETIYDEPATITTQAHVGNGPMFDVNGGFRLGRRFGLGAGYSRFSDESGGTFIAEIPHPLFEDLYQTTTGPVTLNRVEQAIYIQAVWFIPVTTKFDVALAAGPSFIRTSQDLVTTVTVPAGTQTATPNVEAVSGTATGVMVGLDLTYLFTPRFGGGLFARYNGGSLDLATVEGLEVGGFQVGLGARVRF
jgi:hypothetical protein